MFVLIAIEMWIKLRIAMKTIQMTLDEDLLNQVDGVIRKLKTNRSAFIRESLQYYLERLKIKELEERHRDGYLKYPVQASEFDIWEDEQV